MSKKIIPKYLKEPIKQEWNEFSYFAKDAAKTAKDGMITMGQFIYAELLGLESGVSLKEQFKNYGDFINEEKIPLKDKIEAHIFPGNVADVMVLLMGEAFPAMIYLISPDTTDKKSLLDFMKLNAEIYFALTPIRMLNRGKYYDTDRRYFFDSIRNKELNQSSNGDNNG